MPPLPPSHFCTISIPPTFQSFSKPLFSLILKKALPLTFQSFSKPLFSLILKKALPLTFQSLKTKLLHQAS
jgi:hypothetical protein